jgi:hypothetical protein
MNLSDRLIAATQARGRNSARLGGIVTTIALIGETSLGIAMILWLRTEGSVWSVGTACDGCQEKNLCWREGKSSF